MTAAVIVCAGWVDLLAFSIRHASVALDYIQWEPDSVSIFMDLLSHHQGFKKDNHHEGSD